MKTIIMHMDLDSFFASVEKTLNPEISNLPVAISAPRGQAIVTAATYDAKAQGVKVGMSRQEAKKKCPSLVFVTNRMEAYALVSARVKKIIEQYIEEYETLGMDECFIDFRSVKEKYKSKVNLSDTESCYKLLAEIGKEIALKIEDELHITISIGIASNKIIAKLATEHSKPNGFLMLNPQDEMSFLYKQKIKSVMGIGPKTQEKLSPLNYEVMGDLLGISQRNLEALVGKYQGKFIYTLVNNLPFTNVEKNPYTKSMGATRSMRYHEKNPESVFEELLSEILNRLHKQDRSTRVISVVKVGDVKGYAKKYELASPTKDKKTLAFQGRRLYQALPDVGAVNFIGVTLSKLGDVEQLTLTEDAGLRIIKDTPPVEQKLIASNISLHNAAHYGLIVNHENYGDGKVIAYSKEGLRVVFGNEVRIFDLENLQKMKVVVSEEDWEMVREY